MPIGHVKVKVACIQTGKCKTGYQFTFVCLLSCKRQQILKMHNQIKTTVHIIVVINYSLKPEKLP